MTKTTCIPCDLVTKICYMTQMSNEIATGPYLVGGLARAAITIAANDVNIDGFSVQYKRGWDRYVQKSVFDNVQIPYSMIIPHQGDQGSSMKNITALKVLRITLNSKYSFNGLDYIFSKAKELGINILVSYITTIQNSFIFNTSNNELLAQALNPDKCNPVDYCSELQVPKIVPYFIPTKIPPVIDPDEIIQRLCVVTQLSLKVWTDDQELPNLTAITDTLISNNVAIIGHNLDYDRTHGYVKLDLILSDPSKGFELLGQVKDAKISSLVRRSALRIEFQGVDRPGLYRSLMQMLEINKITLINSYPAPGNKPGEIIAITDDDLKTYQLLHPSWQASLPECQ